jgi:lysophospholipase L1-like esterase
MVRRLLVVCAIAGAAVPCQPQAQTKLACLGTSITEIGLYTSALAQKLGSAYTLANWGTNGTTIMVDCTPWIGSPGFNPSTKIVQVIDSKPDICVLEFGANDAYQWGQVGSCYRFLDGGDKFIHDYNMLLDSLVHSISPVPRMFICLTTPNFSSAAAAAILRDSLIPAIRVVAAARHIPLIDNYTPLLSHPEYFGDGLHPNAAGGQAMADIIYRAVTAQTATSPAARVTRAAARGHGGAQRLYDIRGRLLPTALAETTAGCRVAPGSTRIAEPAPRR